MGRVQAPGRSSKARAGLRQCRLCPSLPRTRAGIPVSGWSSGMPLLGLESLAIAAGGSCWAVPSFWVPGEPILHAYKGKCQPEAAALGAGRCWGISSRQTCCLSKFRGREVERRGFVQQQTCEGQLGGTGSPWGRGAPRLEETGLKDFSLSTRQVCTEQLVRVLDCSQLFKKCINLNL